MTTKTMNTDLAGVHVLNKFIWQKLKEKGLMEGANYSGLIPIIPTNQVAVFNDLPSNTPFIVYTYIHTGYDTDFWADREQIVYRIYSDNERQIRQIMHFLVDLLKRYDWTAEEVNDYVEEFVSRDGDEKKFHFMYTSILGSIGPEPAETEGGRQAASVTTRIVYTHEIQGNPGLSGQGMRA